MIEKDSSRILFVKILKRQEISTKKKKNEILWRSMVNFCDW